MAVRIYLEIGHEASLRTKKTLEGFTHDWEVFVRGCDGAEIHHFVEKVVFYLHETFPKPKRVVKEPPYSVKESGYAGFNLPIDVYLRNNNDPKKITFNYDLQLQQTGPPILKVQKEKYVFNLTSDEFMVKLLKGGGVIGSSSSSQDVSESRTSSEDKNQMINKPKLSGAELVKKPKMKFGEPRDFQELFGSPINMSSKATENKVQSVKPEKSLEKSRTKHSPHKEKDKTKQDSEKKNRGEEKKVKEKSSKDKERSKEKSRKKEKSPARPKSPSPHFSSPPPPIIKHKEQKQHDKEKQKDKVKKEKRNKEHSEEHNKKKEVKVESSPTNKPVEKKEKVKEKPKDEKYSEKYNKHKKKDKEKRDKKEEKHKSEKKSEPKPNLFKPEVKKDKPSNFIPEEESSNSSSSSTISSSSEKKIVKNNESSKPKEEKSTKMKKEKGYQDNIKCKRKSEPAEEEPPSKLKKEVVNVNNNSDEEVKEVEVKPEANVEEDYFSVLQELQHKIMGLKDNNDLQKVVKLIAETGRYEVSDHTFDFDLCLLDRSTVQQLQEFFSNET